MRAYHVSAGRREPPRSPPATEALETILRETLNNFESIVEVMFPLQIFRFFKLRNLVDAGYSLAEIELYGEGFAPEAWFTSEILDLNAPVNFGRIFWDFGKYRWRREWTWTGSEESGEGTGASELDLKRRVVPELWEERLIDPEPVIWEDAPVSISVEVRAGRDDSPLIYHEITEIGERPVTKKEYLRLRERPWAVDVFNPLIPGMRGSVVYDDENWSRWAPIPASRIEATLPDGRRYIQFRVKVFSEDAWAFGQMDALWIEYAAPLAQEVVGEVAVQEDPSPSGGMATVEAGEETTFLYALRAVLDGSGGFDAVRIATPTVPAFEALWMGKPLREVEPDSVALGEGTLEVYLPRRVSRNNDPVQVALRTAVLAYGTQFYGEVWDTERADLLPQGIAPGDAVDEITTNQLQVFVAKASLEVLTEVAIQPEVITPNGDGSNDGATITYTLSLVSGGAEVEVGVYNLAGSKVWRQQEKTKGWVYREGVRWEGRDEEGTLVRPGLYFCRVRVSTDAGEFQEVRPIAVVY